MVYNIIAENGLSIIDKIPHKEYIDNFYINYLKIGNKVILPIFKDKKQDDKAIGIFKDLFGCNNVFPVNANEIATEHGVLNCISCFNVL